MAEDNSKSGSRWDVLTQTGAGTPMGELLRRYWWPIAGASEFAEPGARPVRLLGEDLVLYKDLGGRFGLLDRHCRHRRADLSYGYVEECGLRCNYHGWLYDADGACLAQPYEDMAHPERRLRDEIRIKSYPVEELGGLLWAYLGPEPRPLVPDWEFFSWPNGFRQIVLGRDPVQLVPVPGELDRPGAFRMDPFELVDPARRPHRPLYPAPPPGRFQRVRVRLPVQAHPRGHRRERPRCGRSAASACGPAACSPATMSSSACRSTTRTRCR